MGKYCIRHLFPCPVTVGENIGKCVKLQTGENCQEQYGARYTAPESRQDSAGHQVWSGVRSNDSEPGPESAFVEQNLSA